MALLRVKRPEGLKERSPGQLGQVLGLDRAPEVKTVRAKLARFAAQPIRLEYGPKGRRKRLSLRQVTRLRDSGHQTPILTSRRDLAA